MQLVRYSAPIDVLEDDCLLNIFYLYRPSLLDGYGGHSDRVLLGPKWNRERWWYKLTHVCRRWRYLMLGSASYLGLCLLCTPGTPVADVLAHSPPFPIIIDHFHTDNCDRMTANDVEGIILALEHRDRIRRIRFRTTFPMTEKVIAPIDGDFPILEFLCIAPNHDSDFQFPKTFQAPQLRHLILVNLNCPIGSPLLSPAAGLVTLSLVNIPPSAYFQPDELLHRVGLMPQLETLWIGASPCYSEYYVDLDVTHIHNVSQISLPHLHFLKFYGSNPYLEAVLSRITAPHLEVVQIEFWEEGTFSVPCLLQFMSSSNDIKLRSAILSFNTGGARLSVYPRETAGLSAFGMRVEGRPGHKVSNVAQILNALSPLFSSVVYLTLDYRDDRGLPELQDEAEPTDWRVLLRSFNNVKALLLGKGGVKKLSRSLQLDDGESLNDLLPELEELAYSPSNDNADAFNEFIDARRTAGHPVTLVHLPS